MTTTDAIRYSFIIEWSDEDQLYIATAPELPGCRTHGTTRAEALAKGEEIIEEWLDIVMERRGQVPAPRVFDGWSNFTPGGERRVGASA